MPTEDGTGGAMVGPSHVDLDGPLTGPQSSLAAHKTLAHRLVHSGEHEGAEPEGRIARLHRNLDVLGEPALKNRAFDRLPKTTRLRAQMHPPARNSPCQVDSKLRIEQREANQLSSWVPLAAGRAHANG